MVYIEIPPITAPSHYRRTIPRKPHYYYAHIPMLKSFARNLRHSAAWRQKNPLIHENGLYYGKFTAAEYEEAKQYVSTQYHKLEQEIKGTENVRENVGKMPQFPAQGAARAITNLLDFFAETIKTTGPMLLSAYMRQCLTHPDFGYYTTRDPLDTNGGDFITSPEISSVFGEMFGVWLFSVWQSQGMPRSIQVVEFGPGRGTLMHDTMAVFHKFARKCGVDVAAHVVLIEASPVLRREQARLLGDGAVTPTPDGFASATSKWGHRITWVETEKDVASPDGCANYVLAHEFFDALPIKSFVRTAHGWRELLVEHTPSVVNTQGALAPGAGDVLALEAADVLAADATLHTQFHLTASPKESPSSIIPTLSSRSRLLPEGSRIEVCADAELYVSKIAELVAAGPGGGALIVDYGLSHDIPLNSLRGIYKHKFVSPFFSPGNVDLSVDVDFENLRRIAAVSVEAFGPVDQGDWLHELGIGYRFDQLIKSANLMANKELLYESYLRLTAKDDKSMGKAYKFLGLLPKGSARPAGFGVE